MKQWLRTLIRENFAQDLTEYALLVATLAIFVLMSMYSLGFSINLTYGEISTGLASGFTGHSGGSGTDSGGSPGGGSPGGGAGDGSGSADGGNAPGSGAGDGGGGSDGGTAGDENGEGGTIGGGES